MTKREGIVIAVDPRGRGAKITVELDEKLDVAVSRESRADRRQTETFYLDPERWAEVEADFGGRDNMLARRIDLARLAPAKLGDRLKKTLELTRLGNDARANPRTPSMLCDCGQSATYHPLIGLQLVPMCAECYGREFPERLSTFDLVRVAPNAGEFHAD